MSARFQPASGPTASVDCQCEGRAAQWQGAEFRHRGEGIDLLVEEQALSVAKSSADHRQFLLVTTKAKKPDVQSRQAYNEVLRDLQQDMDSVRDIRDSHRVSPMKEHLVVVGEGISHTPEDRSAREQWYVFQNVATS